jgi:hypothetical protein
MAKAKALDWLAERIIEVFENSDDNFDSHYISDIKDTIAGRDRLSVLIWCNAGLDHHRKAALAKRLNINLDDLITTLKTLQRI